MTTNMFKYGFRGIRPCVTDYLPFIHGSYWPVAATNRSRIIVPHMFVVATGNGKHVDGCRGAIDTVHNQAGARPIVGLVVEVYDSLGRIKDNPYLDTSTAGYVRCITDRNMIFRALQDGVGGPLNLAHYSTALVDGPPIGATSADTNFPDPESGDMIDSSVSTPNATNAHALLIVGKDPSPGNDSATQFAVRFKLNPAYCASV